MERPEDQARLERLIDAEERRNAQRNRERWQNYVKLMDEINRYVAACGGDDRITDARMDAVVAMHKALERYAGGPRPVPCFDEGSNKPLGVKP
jgi:hypothetical protein